MTRRNIKLILAYEGTQDRGGRRRSRVEVLRKNWKAVTQILQHPVNLQVLPAGPMQESMQ